MRTKYTSGPWKTHYTKQILAWDELAQESISVCFIGSGDTTENEDNANALLITAVPEMLKALELVINSNNVFFKDINTLNKCLKAIKKAKGE